MVLREELALFFLQALFFDLAVLVFFDRLDELFSKEKTEKFII